MGSGHKIMRGYVNADLQDVPGVDVVVDLARPELPEGVDEVFSNAFFEHLYPADLIPHLKCVYEALADGGIINYMGIPWFPGVADAYIHGAPSTTLSGQFDIYNAYRYTHGAPEHAYEYLPQLHKSLFDLSVFKEIFAEVKPDNVEIYTYAFPREPDDVRVTCGFYITKGFPCHMYAEEYLERWDGVYINLSSIEIQ